MTPETMHMLFAVAIIINSIHCFMLRSILRKWEDRTLSLRKDFRELSENWSIIAKELREQK